MAKWGEGDPRWIVEERPDATNVNNWHWTEKNVDQWSKDKLKALFVGLSADEPGLGKIEITELPCCKGEAYVRNRKGKLSYFYEWDLELKWKAESYIEPLTAIEGVINIPNLSEENDASDFDVSVTVKEGGKEGQKFREYMNKTFSKVVIEKLQQYHQDLVANSGSGVLLPTKGQTTNGLEDVKKAEAAKITKTFKDTQNQHAAKPSGKVSFTTTSLSMAETFTCTPDELYNVFVTPELVAAFTRREVKLSAEVGAEFSLFGGMISGKFTNLEKPLQIKKTWRRKDWPQNHFSEVTLTFTDKANSTSLVLEQTGVPTSDFDNVKQGWNNYYWEPIKRTFGFHAILM